MIQQRFICVHCGVLFYFYFRPVFLRVCWWCATTVRNCSVWWRKGHGAGWGGAGRTALRCPEVCFLISGHRASCSGRPCLGRLCPVGPTARPPKRHGGVEPRPAPSPFPGPRLPRLVSGRQRVQCFVHRRPGSSLFACPVRWPDSGNTYSPTEPKPLRPVCRAPVPVSTCGWAGRTRLARRCLPEKPKCVADETIRAIEPSSAGRRLEAQSSAVCPAGAFSSQFLGAAARRLVMSVSALLRAHSPDDLKVSTRRLLSQVAFGLGSDPFQESTIYR